MKRLALLGGLIAAVCGVLIFANHQLNRAQGITSGNTFSLYNWGDYIDPELITKFEEETGYVVSYETFDSNEAMYTKIKQGGTNYDMAVPSEYMIERMIDENMLEELDHTQIKGLDNIDQQFLDLPFDPDNQYSIPYFWGTLGIIYNDKFVKEGEIQHWEDLWKPAFADSVMLIDGAREIMGLSLNSMGHSLNSKNDAELAAAAEKLDHLTPNVKAIVADEIKMYMIQEESSVAVTFSGEAAEMLYENEHLHYVIPNEGTNLWFDNIVIPNTAKNKEAAYAFINFMLEPENAAQNAEYIGYSTPNEEAVKLMPEEITEDEQFYPSDETMKHMEVYENLGQEYIGIYNDYFLEFKMHRK
ncbi:ABC transporter substrate-binding protein [Pisciglobus halotolerans]|uniref:Spermidine/putrescine transport system substrate-binding protein n=1 Tax=Pisciglobus halotolerans TaxID=745365 RepID=A0A1I3B3L3_9LACT|nr:ABC transporter substrate-binding protein [Pisciglobus halotolerans]SFH56291.1 spermidine/putrescine transport system substrate-binding protein [Pisciglobus halotolerans]